MAIVPIRATLTSAGLARIARGLTAGTPVTVNQLALGTGGALLNGLPIGYEPAGNEASLRTEVARMDIAAAAQVGAREWTVEASFPPLEVNAAPQWITEVAAILSDGTVLAIWSRTSGPLFARTDATTPAIGFTLAMDELPANAVTFVSVGAPSIHITMLSFAATATAAILELQRRTWGAESLKMDVARNTLVNAA